MEIPKSVAVCPYCGCGLRATVTGEIYDEEYEVWLADQIELDFESEPPIESNAWRPWMHNHTYMPYVYLLPLERDIIDWINKQRRPDIPGLTIPCSFTLDLFYSVGEDGPHWDAAGIGGFDN